MAIAGRTRPVPAALAIVAVVFAVHAGIAVAANRAVTIAGFAYSPPTVTVNVGDRVIWTNADAVGHTATADDGSFDTGNIATGASRGVTFAAAGTFDYYCVPHPSMRGTVVVRAASSGGGAPGPDTSTVSPLPTGDAGLPARAAALSLAAALGVLLALRAPRRRLRQLNDLFPRVRHAPIVDPARSQRPGMGPRP